MVENPRMAASQGAPLWDFWKPCLAEFCTVCCQLSSREAHRGPALQRFDPCHRTLQFTRAGSYYSRSARLLIFFNIADHRDRLRPCSATDLAALQYNRERFRGSWRHRRCVFRWWETVVHLVFCLWDAQRLFPNGNRWTKGCVLDGGVNCKVAILSSECL
jgi:hypothetical protein